MDFLEEFRAVVGALDARNVPYAVCGAWALAFHGTARATDDIDLLVSTSDLDPAMDAARNLGYIFEASPMTLHGGRIEIHRISKPAPGWKDDVLVIDFLVVTPAILDVWGSRERLTSSFGDFWVVSLDGLIKLKRMSGRAQDIADIESLLGPSAGEPENA